MTQLTAQSSVFIMVTSQLVEALIWSENDDLDDSLIEAMMTSL